MIWGIVGMHFKCQDEKASSARMLAGAGRGEQEPEEAQLMALRKLGKRERPETTNNQESRSPLKEQHKCGLSKIGEGKTNKQREVRASLCEVRQIWGCSSRWSVCPACTKAWLPCPTWKEERERGREAEREGKRDKGVNRGRKEENKSCK